MRLEELVLSSTPTCVLVLASEGKSFFNDRLLLTAPVVFVVFVVFVVSVILRGVALWCCGAAVFF